MRTHTQKWKIYLDTCCLSRLDDNPTHDRIQLEANAVKTILNYFLIEQWLWIGSEVLTLEINNTQDQSKRLQAQSRLSYVHQNVFLSLRETSRAKHLESLGFKRMDALHLACAESSNVDVFLTTDDRLIRLAKRFGSEISIRVNNPYEWLQEMIRDEKHKQNGQ